MLDEAFLKLRSLPPKKPGGSWSRSGTFTRLKQHYDNKEPAWRSAMRFEVVRVVRLPNESAKPWIDGRRLSASCPKAAWAKRSATLWVNGNHWKFIFRTLKLKSIIIWLRMRFVRPLLEKTMALLRRRQRRRT